MCAMKIHGLSLAPRMLKRDVALTSRVAAQLFNRYSHNNSADNRWTFLSDLPGGSVDYKKDESSGIATVTLNHPKTKNALSGKMMVMLKDVITDLEQWKSGRGVLLHGIGQNFCSGADLKLMRSIMNAEQGMIVSSFMQDILTRLFCLPLVSVALIEGVSLGGGAELAVATDFRVMSEGASLGFVQAKRGLSPGWGGGVRLVQLVGRTNALKILTTACILGSREADRQGLADLVISKESDGVTEALKFLGHLTEASSPVVQANKRAVVNGTRCDFEQAMIAEREIFQTVWCGPDHMKNMLKDMKFVDSTAV